MTETKRRGFIWLTMLITVLLTLVVSSNPLSLQADDKKTNVQVPKWYRALCESLITGNVEQVLVTDRPIPGVDKRAVLVWVLTDNQLGRQHHAFWIDLDSKNADQMQKSVIMAFDKNYPVQFNEGAVDPETGVPKKAVDTVILVNPLVGYGYSQKP